MAAFKFRLQNVLDYRNKLVARLRNELAVLEARLAEADRQLAGLRAAERVAMERLKGSRHRVLDVAEMIQLTEHLDVLAERVARQATVVAATKKAVDLAQARLVEVNTGLKALEKLRDREAEEFATKLQRQEQTLTDEIAMRQYRRLRAAI